MVAVDGSDTSNLALEEAINLAKDQHSSLRLIHVVDLTLAYTAVEAPYVVEYQNASRAAGQKVIADCSTTIREARIKFDMPLIVVELLGQHIHDAIEEEAKQWPADLIVIGTHGRRGFRRLLLGSIAEGVTRIASKPCCWFAGHKKTQIGKWSTRVSWKCKSVAGRVSRAPSEYDGAQLYER
jgi:nucleotide-binding universal stress UspA family protein